MMLAQRALALVAGLQERLCLVGRDERQGTIHTRPGRRAGRRGEGKRGTERGHRSYPLLLWGTTGSVHTGPPGALGCVAHAPALRSLRWSRLMHVANTRAIAC